MFNAYWDKLSFSPPVSSNWSEWLIRPWKVHSTLSKKRDQQTISIVQRRATVGGGAYFQRWP